MSSILAQTIAQNTPSYLQELAEFIKIPSISTDPAYKADVEACATWVATALGKLGASNVTIHPTSSHPVVTAQIGNNPAKPTVLVYGHYDVQPVGNLAEWHSPPFDLTERDGKIFARGTTDDKGQLFCYFKAIELLQTKGELPCNIKFLVEGAEEIGSVGLEEFMAANPTLTTCDVAVISDTSIVDENTPAITAGLRGNVVLQVRYNGPNKELHSGFFGGAVANPVVALCHKIAELTNAQGRITLPNFYDDVHDYTTQERALFNQQPNFESTVRLETGVDSLATGELGYTALEQIGIRPCLSVMSFHAGPDLGLVKGVIPPFAEAMVGLRLVPHQNPANIAKAFEAHFASNLPAGITATTTLHGASTAWAVTSFDDAGYKAAHKAYEASFGKAPVPVFCGGSIPIVASLAKAGANPTLLGFGLGSDNLHSPNEHISINRLQKGIETLARFFEGLDQK